MGDPGSPGTAGLHCWDLDSDRQCGAAEDVDQSGTCDPGDCLGEQGEPGEVGPAGPAGPAGDPGAAGAAGAPGSIGPAGPAGPQGDVGPTGAQGLPGDVGAIGPPGLQGDVGPTGPQGLQGDIGPQGLPGDVGAVGAVGPQGLQGDIGPQGLQGDIGPQGLQGLAGSDGAPGAVGPTGDTGPAGPQGAQGPQGNQGIQGFTGQTGAPGTPGAPGSQGPQGIQGLPGANGAPGSVGPPGAQGPQGPQGVPGLQNTIVASVNTQFSLDDRAGWTHVEALADDTCTLNIPLGFSFTGFGANTTSVSMSSNGILFFGQGCFINFTNTALPTNLTTDAMFAFFWDDMQDFGGNEFVEYTTMGTAPARVFHLYLRMRIRNFCGTDTQNMLVTVHEGSNLVKASYSAFSGCAQIRGTAATFGLQAANGSQFVNVGFNVPLLDDNNPFQSISFHPPPAAQ